MFMQRNNFKWIFSLACLLLLLKKMLRWLFLEIGGRLVPLAPKISQGILIIGNWSDGVIFTPYPLCCNLWWRLPKKVVFWWSLFANLWCQIYLSFFSAKEIWGSSAPSKVCFVAWEATWGKIVIVDQLMRRGRFLLVSYAYASQVRNKEVTSSSTLNGLKAHGHSCSSCSRMFGVVA